MGGTVGDIESQPFLEAIRQFQHEVGHENAILIHVTLIPYLQASGEMKTKPTQAVRQGAAGHGYPAGYHRLPFRACPWIRASRTRSPCSVTCPAHHVLQNLDVEYLYEAPLAMEKEHLAQVACECLNLPCPEPDLTDWTNMVDALEASHQQK